MTIGDSTKATIDKPRIEILPVAPRSECLQGGFWVRAWEEKDGDIESFDASIDLIVTL